MLRPFHPLGRVLALVLAIGLVPPAYAPPAMAQPSVGQGDFGRFVEAL
jgi:hypothetical protein